MKVQTIFSMSSPYRDDFRIKAFTFGEGERTLCIVGAMRGDEMQQQYVASRIVMLLKRAEAEQRIAPGISISVIPCVNPSSINIEKRFWALDNTDINRMFPGYAQGETTQRIAAGLFEFIKDFKYGIQLASYYLPGNFIPHVRMMKTGFEDVADALFFGFPYVAVHNVQPFDTVLLNYNWQIWQTQAFSLYAGTTDVIDQSQAQMAIDGVAQFLGHKGFLNDVEIKEVTTPRVIEDRDVVNVQSPRAGILLVKCKPGQPVHPGTLLAHVLDPYEGRIISTVTSPVEGLVFFARNKAITYQNTLLFRIITT